MSMFGFVFFKQKTAYEMRISDWSSDVCSSDLLPGITRRRRGRYWQYFDAKGERITDRDEIDRLNGVGLPPAYKDAWFCPSPEGHIQHSAERRVGNECVSTGRSRWSQVH